MKYRNLRIAWSVGCGIACVLLVVLWAFSYSNGPGKGYFNLLPDVCSRSTNGVVFFIGLYSPSPVNSFPDVSFHDSLTKQNPLDMWPAKTLTGFYFRWESASYWSVQFPYWFPVLL